MPNSIWESGDVMHIAICSFHPACVSTHAGKPLEFESCSIYTHLWTRWPFRVDAQHFHTLVTVSSTQGSNRPGRVCSPFLLLPGSKFEITEITDNIYFSQFDTISKFVAKSE